MAKQEKTGYLADQIELAQRSLESWPKWLQEATGVKQSPSEAGDVGTAMQSEEKQGPPRE
jgi:hypothetical protein